MSMNPLLMTGILAGLLASIACGVIGPYVVTKRIVFLVGAIAHMAIGGIGAAIFLRHHLPASFGGLELFSDPHLKQRGFAEEVTHPVIGRRKVINVPWRFSTTPPQVTSYAPLLGEHNEYVFGELLGMPQEEIQRLVAEGALLLY